MNFFSSVFSAPAEEEEGEEQREGEQEQGGEQSGGGWIFGGLIDTLKEEIEEQRKVNESSAAAEEAERGAASALPSALEAGASVASDRLESVGQAVDDLGAAAAGLLSHANEALRSAEADGEDGDVAPRASDASASGASWRASLPSKKYTRFEAQVLALRADPATFTEEPEDSEGFTKWNSSFSTNEVKEQIEGVLRESPGLESFVERLVPSVVDYETFWSRYFFAVDKLKQAEDVRTKLVNRAMSKEEDEELSWDVDDDDEETHSNDQKEGTNSTVDKKEEEQTEASGKQEAAVENDSTKDKEVALAVAKNDNGESNVETVTPKSSDGTGQEEKTEAGDSSKETDFSVVSQPSVQEEDLSWEEIEDVGDEDDKKGASSRSSSVNKVEDLRKRLNSVEDDEDLSWDIDE